MEPTSLTVNEGFDRLERLLLAMHVGDMLSVTDTASVTGLAEHTCLAVFEGLERAGLMARGSDAGVFVRKTLELQA
jgi:DNA-binding transcriptional regulator YhcF (GntR family)